MSSLYSAGYETVNVLSVLSIVMVPEIVNVLSIYITVAMRLWM